MKTIDFNAVTITITNEELLNLSIRLEEEEKLKFEVYDAIRKGESETPSAFKARRNERIREEYKLGGTSIKELAEKFSLTDRAIKKIVKGIKKPARANYIDRRNNHTVEFKDYLSDKIEREIELDAIKRDEFKPLSIDEVEYYSVPYKHKESLLPYDCCMVDTETGELIKVVVREREYGKPKNHSVVKKALETKPDELAMQKLNKYFDSLRVR